MTRPGRKSGFTLLEALITTVVLGIIAGVTLPLINASTDMYAASSQASRAVDEMTFALDRVVTILREAPPGMDTGTIGVSDSSSTMIEFTDGTGCRLNGTDLLIRFADGSEGVVAKDIEIFELRFLASDGSDTSSTPGNTQRFEIRLSHGGLDLRTVAFCRTRYGS